jgi:hypothetical protein
MINKSYPTTGVQPHINTRFNQQSETFTAQMYNHFTAQTSSVATDSFSANYFTLDGFPDYTAFTALFDQYRIKTIELWFEPTVTQALVTSPEICWYLTVPDLDDAAAPATFSAIQNKPGGVQSSIMQSHYHKFQPRAAVCMFKGGFTGYGQSEPNIWLDCSSPDIQFYGIKIGVSQSTNVVKVALTVRATVEFRGIA